MDNLAGPEDFIVKFANLVPPGAEVLDVAAGRGRHARFFAQRGCRVIAIERDPEALAELRRLPIEVIEGDIENAVLLPIRFDALVNTFFLHRPLLTQYQATLRPNGVLFFRTFTTAHLDVLGHAKPRREFLLKPGELRDAFSELRILHYEETVGDGPAMATIVACKPAVMPE